MKRIAIYLLIFFPLTGLSETLLPGFSKSEYVELLKISAKQGSDPLDTEVDSSNDLYKCIYKSHEMGLHNQWELWENTDDVAVISIRGTSKDFVSWIANFYVTMVPAKGRLQLEKNYIFEYELASDPKAAVHTGWLIGTGMLARDILPKIDSLTDAGIKNFLIMGHSQGGAIAYLMTSHLYHLRKIGRLPADVIFKTYCSAAPKPGNLFYAYSFEDITSEGWAFNVVNAADWIPEMPLTTQTISDYNNVNPFMPELPILKKQKLLRRLILKQAYGKLSGLPQNSQEATNFYMGERIFSMIKKSMPEFEKPKYFESINYVRAGRTIVLIPDENYWVDFPYNPNRLYIHHLFEPYFHLIGSYEPTALP